MQYYMIAVGAVLILFGLAVLASRVLFLFRAERAAGEVVEVVERSRRDGARIRIYFHPKVRFTTMAGKAHEIIGRVGSTKRSYRTGETVPVMYDPRHPEKALVGKAVSIWGLPAALLVLGAGALYGGLKGVLGS